VEKVDDQVIKRCVIMLYAELRLARNSGIWHLQPAVGFLKGGSMCVRARVAESMEQQWPGF